MNYVDEPRVDDVPTNVAAVRMYMALLMRAGSSTGREFDVAKQGAMAIATLWPEPIDEWSKQMGMPPAQKIALSDAKSAADSMMQYLALKGRDNDQSR